MHQEYHSEVYNVLTDGAVELEAMFLKPDLMAEWRGNIDVEVKQCRQVRADVLYGQRMDAIAAEKLPPAKENRRRSDSNLDRVLFFIQVAYLLSEDPVLKVAIASLVDRLNTRTVDFRARNNQMMAQKYGPGSGLPPTDGESNGTDESNEPDGPDSGETPDTTPDSGETSGGSETPDTGGSDNGGETPTPTPGGNDDDEEVVG